MLLVAWASGIGLLFVTIFIHVGSIVVAARVASHARQQVVAVESALGAVGFVAGVAIFLAFVIIAEAAIWASAYVGTGAAASFPEAMIYSIGSLTTRGSTVTIASPWRALGVIEAVTGIIVFGITTAFLYSIIRRVLEPNLYRRG